MTGYDNNMSIMLLHKVSPFLRILAKKKKIAWPGLCETPFDK
jgi:hypothetical protein